MIFKDRSEAGKKLVKALKKKYKETIVVSLLRGGVIVGNEISKSLKSPHLALAVAKIPAPLQPELAMGAVCFDFTYLEPSTVRSLGLDKNTIIKQIAVAKDKFASYLKRFALKKTLYRKLKNKTIILVDDGIATGSTIKVSLLFLESLKPTNILLACPVAPKDFENPGFKQTVILHKNIAFSSVSQFYKNFPQVEDEEIKRLLY